MYISLETERDLTTSPTVPGSLVPGTLMSTLNIQPRAGQQFYRLMGKPEGECVSLLTLHKCVVWETSPCLVSKCWHFP